MHMYFARTLKIAKNMKSCGKNMQENIITTKILRSMITKLNYVVCFIKQSNNADTMSINELQSSLLVHEQIMMIFVEEDRVMQIVSNERSGRGRGRER